MEYCGQERKANYSLVYRSLRCCHYLVLHSIFTNMKILFCALAAYQRLGKERKYQRYSIQRSLPSKMCIRDRDQFTQMCLKGADVNTFPSQSLLEHVTSHYLCWAELKTEVITHMALVEDIVPRLKVKPVQDYAL